MSTAFASGCSTTPPLYHWGQYETLIYNMYKKPGTATPQQQIITLTEDLEKAANRGLNVAPGIYAHLGFMYALDGKQGLSQEAFEKEIALFPESKVLIEGMLERALKAAADQTNTTPTALPTDQGE